GPRHLPRPPRAPASALPLLPGPARGRRRAPRAGSGAPPRWFDRASPFKDDMAHAEGDSQGWTRPIRRRSRLARVPLSGGARWRPAAGRPRDTGSQKGRAPAHLGDEPGTFFFGVGRFRRTERNGLLGSGPQSGPRERNTYPAKLFRAAPFS